MAKKIKTVYDRINDYLKKYQSGQDTVGDFNGKFGQSQLEFANYLFSIHAINERASELIQCIIPAPASVTSDVNGVFTKPANFMYFLSASYLGKPVHKVAANQLDTYELIPQRRGSLTAKRVNITGVNNGWQGRPTSAYTIVVTFVRTPPAATIVFTTSETDDEDILIYEDATTVDFVWPEECIPILVFLILEKVGVSVREELLREYAQLGLSKEAVA